MNRKILSFILCFSAASAAADDASLLKLLSYRVSPSDFGSRRGSYSGCQPESYDPVNRDETGKIKRIHGVEIIEFDCDSSSSFIAELMKDGKRLALFTQIDNWLDEYSFSRDGQSMYLANNMKKPDGTWQKLFRIIGLKDASKTKLPEKLPCVSDFGFWDGDLLVTHSDKNRLYADNKTPSEGELKDYATDICVWNAKGELKARLSSKIHWMAAASYAPVARMGVLPKDPDIFYVNTLDLAAQDCALLFQSLSDPKKGKKIPLKSGGEFPQACDRLKLDLSHVTFESSSVPFAPAGEGP